MAGGKLPILLRQRPGRLGRERRRRLADLRVVGEADRRPDHDAALLLNETHKIVVAVVGRGAEQIRILVPGESRVRWGTDRGKKPLAVDVNEDRLVVGDELRKQRNNEQSKENP